MIIYPGRITKLKINKICDIKLPIKTVSQSDRINRN